MLSLHYQDPATGKYSHFPVLCTAPHFLLLGPALLVGPGQSPLASYHNGLWHADGRSVIVLLTQAPTRVVFQARGAAPAASYGPYDWVRVVGHTIRHAPVDELLAQLDEASQRWHVPAAGLSYPSVLLAPP